MRRGKAHLLTQPPWSSTMARIAFIHTSMVAGLLALALSPAEAEAQSRVQYGRVTNVVATTVNNSTSQNVGTLVGGGVGLASGSGQSGSNRALRTLGGAAAGRGVGTLAGRSQAFEYTVLVGGTTTIRIVSDQAGKRVGDCVAVEQGQFSNIRLVPDARCTTPAPRPAAPAPARPPAAAPVSTAAVQAANACEQAKAQVLAAETDDAFDLAERRMRLLCGE
jgi:outer membrane lipoprotein SlyB